MDAATVLEQYVSDLANLPAEIAHILEEIRDKDIKFYDTRKKIQQRDNQIHKFIKANGSLTDNPKEQLTYPKIRADFEKAREIQQQKLDLSNTGLYILARHVKSLNDDIAKLEDEGLLPPMTSDQQYSSAYTSYDVSRQPSVSLGQNGFKSRPASAMGTHVNGNATPLLLSSTIERKKSPTPAPRSTTPTSLPRPIKRQKISTTTDSPGVIVSRATNVNGTGSSGTARANRPQISPSVPSNNHNTGEDEVLYCTCQQVSFGNMVACDNPDCQYEWFHYDCVGLKEPPSGTWYCPPCTKERRDARDAKDKEATSNKRKK